MSICASLDSAATARGREGLPRCGFHNKMINDVFVLSYKRCCIRFSFKARIEMYSHDAEECESCGIKTLNGCVI